MRQNSAVAVGIECGRADYGFSGNLELKVFELQSRAEIPVYQGGKEIVRAAFERKEDRVYGRVTGAAGCRIRFVNCRLACGEGVNLEAQGKDTVIAVDENDMAFCCRIGALYE